MIKTYKKRPVLIEAVKFTRKNIAEVKSFTKDAAHTFGIIPGGACKCIVDTQKGLCIATEGDYIIKGVVGEFYPCKPDIFESTYEEVYEED